MGLRLKRSPGSPEPPPSTRAEPAATTVLPVQSAPTPPLPSPPESTQGRRRWPWVVGLGLGLIIAAVVAAAVVVHRSSGASLVGDPSALAKVEVETFGGTIQSARAVGPNGKQFALAVDSGRLTPLRKVTPGQVLSVEVVLHRPSWDGWLIGATKTERLSVTAPVAHVSSRWLTVKSGSTLKVGFTEPVTTVTYSGGGLKAKHLVQGKRQEISLKTKLPAGSVKVAAAVRPWENVGPAVMVRYFPRTRRPLALVSPAPGGTLAPSDPIRLSFSKTVKSVLGDTMPTLSPATAGKWRKVDAHTVVFKPTGFGVPLGTTVRLKLPRAVAAADATGRKPNATRVIEWTVPPPSDLRLQQLLADAGYLPYLWKPAGAAVARTPRDEATAAAEPPEGRFVLRYSNTPHELRHLWQAGAGNTIQRGAVMMFQNEHNLAVDGIAGKTVWRDLLDDAIKNKRHTDGYSYVYVHRNVPQLLTLWHNGHTVMTSPGNTGVPAAPTQLGTFPVFEHLSVTTMSGTNPDGSKYNDPGIKWVSYFNGGDALHSFNRASFGTPQSLGCVELPLASAAKLWPYTPIGTLVTIEP